MKSSQLTYASGTVGIVDSPLVDSSAAEVYVFVGDDANTGTSVHGTCDSSGGCSGVFQFGTGNSSPTGSACVAANSGSYAAWPSGSNCGEEAVFGVGTTTTPTIYDGAFDQIYYNGSGASGNLWVCSAQASAEPRLSYVPLQSGGGIVVSGDGVNVTGTSAILSLASSTATCSPVTEVYGSNGSTTDYIFLSVTANGALTTTDTSASCTGACLYNFRVATGGTLSSPSTAYAGIAAASGTSGIIIDNNLATASGESQIYFTSLANGSSACAGNGTTGNTIGGCAVQASQTAP
jgi:hypothetical protein